ncbi:hypothetical protein Pmani_014173 [Petrolisthes manimaculis]|uniref:Uncharacterized protein n=1 Tax=Petrolisthes manimaculis TaxID=1843537 RepID=A0AAE1PUM3_9EUCA|nr:hypothetical protein Pmani_014173 [Petrolisthes manimaculis]
MISVTNATNEAEQLYYRTHIRTRVIVKLTLGVVKNHQMYSSVWWRITVPVHSFDICKDCKYLSPAAQQVSHLIIMKDTLTTANPWGSAAVLWAATLYPLLPLYLHTGVTVAEGAIRVQCPAALAPAPANTT